MRLTKERKAYVAVFGLGLVALIADRLFFAPAGARAATEAAAEPEPTAEVQHAPAAPAVPAGPTFIERLSKQASWQQGPLQDAFTAPVAWVGTRVAPEEGPAVAIDGTAFAAAHRLTAVAKGAKGQIALVSGKAVFKGQVLDGYTLVDVIENGEVRAAIFERDGVRVQLEVGDGGQARKTDKAAIHPSQEARSADTAQNASGPQNR